MEQPTITTARCILCPPTTEDAEWMYRLFNDKDVIAYIEGIKWFNSDINATRLFITSMRKNFQHELGMLWCIFYRNQPIGIIMANDLNEDPFYSFALFPSYRGLELMKECITETNRYLNHYYHLFPTISTVDSNLQAIKLMQKLSLINTNLN